MKAATSFIQFITYTNLFVSFCVAAFTHLSYIIYDLPSENMGVVLVMVFSFTFFTYNGQRLFRLKTKIAKHKTIGDRLKWVVKHEKQLIYSAIFFGLIGLVCTYFLDPKCWILLIPMGGLSVFYVIPLLPFYSKSPTLRQIPFLKLFVIAFVWSIVVVGLPFIDTQFNYWNDQLSARIFAAALLQVFCFIVGITIPFDIRDLQYDRQDKLQTIPRAAGVLGAIVCSEIFLGLSLLLLYVLLGSSPLFYTLLIGHLMTMILILFSNEKRGEMFFAGWIEGSVLLVYALVLIADYLSFL